MPRATASVICRASQAAVGCHVTSSHSNCRQPPGFELVRAVTLGRKIVGEDPKDKKTRMRTMQEQHLVYRDRRGTEQRLMASRDPSRLPEY
jgi:hypothetical protein